MRRSLTKAERLKTQAEISRVFDAGEGASCKGMRLVAAENGLDLTRMVVIPARGHKGAVQRNATKRLAREAFRLLKGRIASGFDLAIICYPGNFHYADRHEQLVHLLSRLRLLTQEH